MKPWRRASRPVNRPGFPSANQDHFGAVDRVFLFLQLGELLACDIFGTVFRFNTQQLQSRIDQRHGSAAWQASLTAGNILVSETDCIGDGIFISTGHTKFGVWCHDDLVAGHGDQHGMTLNGRGHEGNGGRSSQFSTGEVFGQLIAGSELAATSELALAWRHVELEDEHGGADRSSQPDRARERRTVSPVCRSSRLQGG